MDSTATPRSRVTLLRAGHRIASRYVIESVISEGASSVVYLARREREHAPPDRVALKVIHRHLCSDEQIFKRFQREAQILQRLSGQHIVRCYEFIEEDGMLIIALEHVEGVTLESKLETDPPSLDEAVEIALQISAALGAAHAAGVVHRDLKPGNVLIERLTQKSTAVWVRVVDFGLAKVVWGDQRDQPPTALTEGNMIFGTPEYMAPEQARGDEVDLRADIYAAGVMLYEMAVGQAPFHGRSPLATMTAHLNEEPPHPRSSRSGQAIPPSLAAVIVRALAKEPGRRYPSARAFAEALTAAWGERLVITPRPSADALVDPRDLEDPDALATFDTELNVNTKGLKDGDKPDAPVSSEPVGITLRSEPGDAALVPAPAGDAVAGDMAVAGRGSARARQAPEIRIESAPPRPLSDERWFWIAAVLAAVVCMIVGVWIGTR